MSYEGYEVFVCLDGHRWSHDVYDPGRSRSCPYCQKDAAWSCSVDQTNCEYEGPKLEIAEQAPTCKCCGQTTGPARYVVPGPEVKAVYVGVETDE